MESKFVKIADDNLINQVAKSLKSNGIDVVIAKDSTDAKQAVLELIPKGSEVFTGTSVTLEETGIKEALDSPDYNFTRNQMMKLASDPTKKKEMKQIGGVTDYMVSGAHAITHDGKILVASATGSQIPAEAYGADKVILVVGAQKIVKDLAEGIERIQQYIYPLEEKRAMSAYGIHTAFNKLLVINAERPDRLTIVLVKEKLGF